MDWKEHWAIKQVFNLEVVRPANQTSTENWFVKQVKNSTPWQDQHLQVALTLWTTGLDLSLISRALEIMKII